MRGAGARRRRRRRPPRPLLLRLLAAAAAPRVCAGGGGGPKLWELGPEVEASAITVFSMFCFVVCITILVECTKHWVEHKTTDGYRKKSLGVIYGELMMIGVISFVLVLSAELGLMDVRITIGCPDETDDTEAGSGSGVAASASGSGSVVAAAGSGSGSECGYGFDILLFEYAHLVLFLMGIFYCTFIQVAFANRDRMVQVIKNIEEETLGQHFMEKKNPANVRGIMGWTATHRGWARTVLIVRSAILLQNEQRIRNCCQLEEQVHARWLAAFRGEPPPSAMPLPEEALEHFKMSRFCFKCISDSLLDLLHVPAKVWIGILVISAANLIHKAGFDLAYAVLMIAGFPPLTGALLLWRMSKQLAWIASRAAGHPRLASYDLHTARGPRDGVGGVDPMNPLELPPAMRNDGLIWSQKLHEYQEARETTKMSKEAHAQGYNAGPQVSQAYAKKVCEDLKENNPWTGLDGMFDDDHPCNAADPLDEGNLAVQIQLTTFASCFYLGQVAMLSTLIVDHLGVAICMACWLLPLPTFTLWMPRCIMVFALTHKTNNCPRAWLRYACELDEDNASVKNISGHGHHSVGTATLCCMMCCGCCGGDSDDEADDPHDRIDMHRVADVASGAAEFDYDRDQDSRPPVDRRDTGMDRRADRGFQQDAGWANGGHSGGYHNGGATQFRGVDAQSHYSDASSRSGVPLRQRQLPPPPWWVSPQSSADHHNVYGPPITGPPPQPPPGVVSPVSSYASPGAGGPPRGSGFASPSATSTLLGGRGVRRTSGAPYNDAPPYDSSAAAAAEFNSQKERRYRYGELPPGTLGGGLDDADEEAALQYSPSHDAAYDGMYDGSPRHNPLGNNGH